MHACGRHALSAVAGVCLCATAIEGQGAAGASTGRTDDERGRLELALGDDLRVSLGGYLQVDGRWSSGPQSRAPDGMLLRRARLVFDAARPDGWHVRLQPDFGQGRVLIQDAFVGWRADGMAVRLGRFRPAFGTERTQSSSTLLFPERSIVNTLMPSRSMGVQVTGEHRRLNMAIGAFRTPISTDVQVVDTDGDVGASTGVGHDLLARIGWRLARRGRYLDAQAGLLAGHEQGTTETPAVPRVLSVGQLPIAAARNDDGRVVIADGARQRWSVGAIAGTARTMMGVEVAHGAQQVRLDAATAVQRTPLRITAVSWRSALLFRGTRSVSQDVSPLARGGALELGVRAGHIVMQARDLTALLAEGSARRATTAGVALSWIPTVSTRLSLAVDATSASFAGHRERTTVMRWQQAF